MPRKKSPTKSLFPLEVGVAPYVVRVVERAGKWGGMVYLQWWKSAKNNHGWQSLKFRVAGRSAEEIAQLVVKAQSAAQRKYEEISGQRAPERAHVKRILTLADAWSIITDPQHGKYPKASRYRRQLADALTLAARVLGETFAWVSLDKAALRRVVRRQADLTIQRNNGKHVGFRPAQIMGTRLLTIATLLHDEGYLPEGFTVPGGKAWHAELRTYVEQSHNRQLPETARPRYVEGEIDALHAVAPQVDPRFALMIEIGELLRPEQVGRTWRSQISADLDRMRIEGRGKKRGQVMLLADVERAALRRAFDAADPLGYLADQEAAWLAHERDYVLFPSAVKRGVPARAIVGHSVTINKNQVQKWMRLAEELAGIPRVSGRGWYGLRRGGTDYAADEGLAGAALQNAFGWTSSKMATDVYEDRQRSGALEEAREFRAKRATARASRRGAVDEAQPRRRLTHEESLALAEKLFGNKGETSDA